MIHYTKYDKASGAILQNGSTKFTLENLESDKYGYLEGTISNNKYVLVPRRAIANKLVNPATIDSLTIEANAVDSVIISNIPIGTEAQMSGKGIPFTKTIINDGEIEFVTSEVGMKLIKLVLFPYLDKEFKIDAT